MPFNRHRIWHEVEHIAKGLEDRPRKGYESVVEVFVRDRKHPVVVLVAETHRDPDYPWVKLYTGDTESSYVFVHEACIEWIEVRHRRAGGKGRSVGFRAEIAGDDGAVPDGAT